MIDLFLINKKKETPSDLVKTITSGTHQHS